MNCSSKHAVENASIDTYLPSTTSFEILLCKEKFLVSLEGFRTLEETEKAIIKNAFDNLSRI
jgi:hypothetical protein